MADLSSPFLKRSRAVSALCETEIMMTPTSEMRIANVAGMLIVSPSTTMPKTAVWIVSVFEKRRADSKIAKRENVDQRRRGEDLSERADQAVDCKGRRDAGQFVAAKVGQGHDVEQGKWRRVGEA